ncbi:hypothetical protein [Pseudomaricurvus sp.]|uniref:hypothetical protein n=1 Tax=Pseudomaricurvus sp. TaxID=2004510 RepID=UPI003F6A8821
MRLKSYYHGETGFQYNGAAVVNSALEKRDPALKNITEELHNLGLVFDIDGCSLFWFQIDDDQTCDFYHRFNEVEVVFESEWFEAQKARIRGMAGTMYYDACAEIARSVVLKDQSRPISYSLPTKVA